MADERFRYLSREVCGALLSWHRELDENRGARAVLRRAGSGEDILLSDAFFNFLVRVTAIDWRWKEKKRLLSSAMVAGLSAHVKENLGSATFAAQLARPKPDATRAPMSALRFQNLQKSRTPEDFYRNMMNAIKLLDGRVNLLSMADGVLHWMDEYDNGLSLHPLDRLAVSWANDYYLELDKTTRTAS